MDKPSLKALRERFDKRRRLARYEVEPLLAIAEAAQGVKDVFPNSHPNRCLCDPCVKHKHLRAALALVVE